MKTVNISLPKKMATQLDNVVQNQNYASRSEFFRTLIRFYLHTSSQSNQNQIILETFVKQPPDKVETQLKNSNQYNDTFIKSVVSGLKKSSL